MNQGKLNRPRPEAEAFMIENKGKMTQEKMAAELGVKPARISQIFKEMRERPSTSVAPAETALAPEAA